MVELSGIRDRFDPCDEGVEPVDVLSLWILAAAGVASVVLFAVRGVLDQLPQVFAAWHRARRAIRERPDGDDQL
ncbi:hypothetical protein [Streptomyces albiflavescens]|uniref:hypothetical protein n=1 Tax=Streptomyces albiflavescens TaxID=1623582 RepID=UPI001666EEE4|nr:hypothetical protein [Streptomyces albiflavescens]